MEVQLVVTPDAKLVQSTENRFSVVLQMAHEAHWVPLTVATQVSLIPNHDKVVKNPLYPMLALPCVSVPFVKPVVKA